MLQKFVIIGMLLSICCSRIAANNMDHYNYGSMDNMMTTTERLNSAVRCVNVNPQNSVDLQQIMGLWYGSEIIMHSQEIPGVYDYDTCVIIHLTDVTDRVRQNQGYNGQGYNNNHRYQYNQDNQNIYRTSTSPPTYLDSNQEFRRLQALRTKYLRLVWSESDNNLEYTFNYTTDAPGQWSNIGDQRGSLVNLNTYSQFSGTVQVVKAVNDHLVLTFCGNDVKSSIYTLVLTRNRLGLSSDELRSIRNMLFRRGLSTETIRKVCNGASGLQLSLAGLLGLLLLTFWAGIKH
ncbi:CG32032 [Drosophila busckii]|uniref:CG32032 n=1 Tax=Drosophila busckii TaxID=30019 RepID=A0A0M4E9Z5_DROBS|nr:CG32032 [Drosophila busckii]